VNQGSFDGIGHTDAERAYELSSGARTFLALLVVSVVVAGVSVGLTLVATGQASTPVAHVQNLSFGVFDTFRRADSPTSLGQSDSGKQWIPRVGTWGVKGAEAYLATPKSRRYNLAVVDTHTGDGTVQVTVARMVESAGLVFRYQNSLNYYAIVAVPKFATWGILRVDHGKLASIGRLGLVPVQNQTTISVLLRGTEIDVAINGQLRRSFANNTLLQTAPYVGLIAFGSGGRNARWVNFVASGAAPAPPAPAPRPAGTAPRPAGTAPRPQTPTTRRRPTTTART
jgi:hypothetical protein